MLNQRKKNMIIKLKYIIPVILLCAMSSSCKSPVITSQEKIVLPEQTIGGYDTAYAVPLSWDSFFTDTVLQGYIRTALQNNYSFRQSLERIEMSRAGLQRAKGMMLPDIGLNIGASVNRFGEYTMDGVGNSETNTPSLSKDKHIPDPYRNFGLSLNFQWEADVWGKLSQKKRAAAARWMASVEATRFAQSALVTELATYYFDLIGLDKRKEVLQQALNEARRLYELTVELKAEGAETQLAVDQFRARVLSIESALVENAQEIGEKERAVATLMGAFPFEVKRISFEELKKLSFPLSDGIPANLLALRPDVREAELELLATKSDVKAARAAFYPSLVLGAGGGFNSFDIGRWFQAPASLIYDLAAGITAPVFRRNEIRSLWDEARSSQRVALSRYHETALTAYMEVLDLYSAGQSQQKRVRLKDVEMESHRRSVMNANELFKLNFVGFLEVLSAEERFLSSELERINIVTNLYRTKVLLYRALGGGC